MEVDQQKQNRRRPTLELVTTKAEGEIEPVGKKAKPTPVASTVVLCSHCKVECGIPVSYEEFENSFKFHPKSDPALRSPPENFQPVSPKQVRSQQEVSAIVRDSNLFQRIRAADAARSEPVTAPILSRSVPVKKQQQPQPDILSKPYIPLAPRSFIKE